MASLEQSTEQRIMASGLFSISDESEFSWSGCDICADNLGATVYEIRGYESLASARGGEDNLITFQACRDCINREYYGDAR